MGNRWGYEYSYDFWVDDKIIPEYSKQLCVSRSFGLKCFLIEIRTNFRLKTRVCNGEVVMMGSERLGVAVHEDHEWWLKSDTGFRLKDYWMSDDEIQSLVRDALDFAKQQRAAADESIFVIPVVVGLDVCTVQQEGEPINATIDRSIRLECLMPLYLWYVIIPKGSMQFDEKPYLDRKGFLMELPRIRVKDEAGLALMDVCPVCSRNSIIGAQISFLPCEHACHSRCVFEWVQKGNSSCPSCGVRIPSDWDRLRERTEQQSTGSDSESEIPVVFSSGCKRGILHAPRAVSEYHLIGID